MARKSKSNSGPRPNAPEFQILQQPAHNPYYPDPSAATLLTSPPPPPYSDSFGTTTTTITTPSPLLPMSQVNSNISYPRISAPGRSDHIPITIHTSSHHYDRRVERYNQKVRSFNIQSKVLAFFSVAFALCAYNLYEGRSCIFDFTVHKPDKDHTITIKDVRNMHLNVIYLSGFLFVFCLAKSVLGYKSKSYCCYRFLITLFTLVCTIFTGYLAYLALYSPCALKSSEIATNLGKTLLSPFVDQLPSPDRGMFGETTVLDVTKEDRNGLIIFILDATNFVFYLSIFLSSLTL